MWMLAAATKGSARCRTENERQTGQTLNMDWILVTQFDKITRLQGTAVWFCSDKINQIKKKGSKQGERENHWNLKYVKTTSYTHDRKSSNSFSFSSVDSFPSCI